MKIEKVAHVKKLPTNHATWAIFDFTLDFVHD